MNEFVAILNPTAGGGACGRKAPKVLRQLESSGLVFDVRRTEGPGHATELARSAWRQGYRRFVAIGGDGTSYEVVNGLYPDALEDDGTPEIGFLPLGTGNSFLRDFAEDTRGAAMRGLTESRTRSVDLVRLDHADGVLFSLNILSIGFIADVCTTANRRFKPLGQASYALGVLAELMKLTPRPFPMTLRYGDGTEVVDREPVTALSFNNSKFTGGTMMMAPAADTADGEMEYIRIGAMSRGDLIRTFPSIYRGDHLAHAKIRGASLASVRFHDSTPVDVMVDGEVVTVRPRKLSVVSNALNVMV